MDMNSSVADVPSMKLAKVGKGREKKRGGAGWFSGARGAGSAFSGAAGGAGGMAGAAGMSLGKILMILAVSGGISAGAWQMGNRIAANSAASAKPAAPKVFDSKDSGKYADTSGVIKQDNSIPNSLGYVNNDGLTDEQRAAKKAADQAAAAKAAADAQAKADADAKAQAVADAKAASAAPDPAAPPAGAPDTLKKSLTPAKFGGMNSSFAGGGGSGGLSGGAGLSGGINGNFGAMGGLGNKSLGGSLAAFRSPSRAATSRAGAQGRGHSNAKGFAKQQLDMANGLSRTALASGKAESAAAGAGAPFDNNPSQGTVISGPGLGSGTQTGPADSGGSTNMNSNSGGPIGNGAACSDANFEPDVNGNCTSRTQTPPAKNAAPYQGLINAAMILLGLIVVLSVIAQMLLKAGIAASAATAGAGAGLIEAAHVLSYIVAAMGAAIVGIGVSIATMKHGDFMIGGILGVVGGFIGYTALTTMGAATTMADFAPEVAHVLIASAIGELAAASTKATGMM